MHVLQGVLAIPSACAATDKDTSQHHPQHRSRPHQAHLRPHLKTLTHPAYCMDRPFDDMIDDEDANFLAALMGMDLPEVAPPAPPAPPPPPAPPAAPTATYQASVTIVNNYYAQPPTATRRDGR